MVVLYTQTIWHRKGEMKMSYPSHVVVKPIKYREDTLETVKMFRDRGPWTGTIEERKTNFRLLHDDLCQIYGVDYRLEFEAIRLSAPPGSSGSSSCNGLTRTITIRNKLSVVTYLHEFGHALGKNEYGACKWSINLFRQVFPEQFNRLNHSGHMVLEASSEVS